MTVVYRVVFSSEAERDFELIFEFLYESQIGFGETPHAAYHSAAARVRSIKGDGESIASAPFRGTLHDDLLPGLRHVTLNRAIFYFDVNEASEEIRILAVFFGGQDHLRKMLARLLG